MQNAVQRLARRTRLIGTASVKHALIGRGRPAQLVQRVDAALARVRYEHGLLLGCEHA